MDGQQLEYQKTNLRKAREDLARLQGTTDDRPERQERRQKERQDLQKRIEELEREVDQGQREQRQPGQPQQQAQNRPGQIGAATMSNQPGTTPKP